MITNDMGVDNRRVMAVNRVMLFPVIMFVHNAILIDFLNIAEITVYHTEKNNFTPDDSL
jgi:hypothetical protein